MGLFLRCRQLFPSAHVFGFGILALKCHKIGLLGLFVLEMFSSRRFDIKLRTINCTIWPSKNDLPPELSLQVVCITCRARCP